MIGRKLLGGALIALVIMQLSAVIFFGRNTLVINTRWLGMQPVIAWRNALFIIDGETGYELRFGETSEAFNERYKYTNYAGNVELWGPRTPTEYLLYGLIIPAVVLGLLSLCGIRLIFAKRPKGSS